MFFAHPPNVLKRENPQLLELAAGRLGMGVYPSIQTGHVDLRGGVSDWASPKRAEDLVVVICGR